MRGRGAMAAEHFRTVAVEVPFMRVPEAYAQRELRVSLTIERAQTLRALVDGLQRMAPEQKIQSAYDALRWLLDELGAAMADEEAEARR